jgi:hypothetical protein
VLAVAKNGGKIKVTCVSIEAIVIMEIEITRFRKASSFGFLFLFS